MEHRRQANRHGHEISFDDTIRFTLAFLSFQRVPCYTPIFVWRSTDTLSHFSLNVVAMKTNEIRKKNYEK